MNKKTTIIATVGVSLLGALARHGIDARLAPGEITELLRHSENPRKFAAEIASVESILEQGILAEHQHLCLLLSDTEQAGVAGAILYEYFLPSFESIELVTIEHLNSSDADLFRNQGLRNLVKAISRVVEDARADGADCVINATGGFKAQISFAGLVGQVLKVPVYYQFEDFANVIQMPELPVELTTPLEQWLEQA